VTPARAPQAAIRWPRARLAFDLEQIEPTLSVFDAYAGLLGVQDLDPNSERDIERVNRQVVDLFRNAGSTVLVLDHVIKAKDSRSRYSSGSARKLAEVEVHLGMERIRHFARGGNGAARIRNHKDRLGGLPYPYVGDLHLTSDPTSGRVTWTIKPSTETTAQPDRFRPTGYMERVSIYLEQQGEAVSKHAIEAHVKGKAEYVRQAIDCLLDEEYATSSPGLRNATLIEHARPYREASDLVPANPETNGHTDLVPRPDLVPTSSPGGAYRPRPSFPASRAGRGRGHGSRMSRFLSTEPQRDPRSDFFSPQGARG
jgi:hypothetical protein